MAAEHLSDGIDRVLAERNTLIAQLAIARGALEFIAQLDGTAGIVARTTLDEMNKEQR